MYPFTSSLPHVSLTLTSLNFVDLSFCVMLTVPKPPVFTSDNYYSPKNKLLHVTFNELVIIDNNVMQPHLMVTCTF